MDFEETMAFETIAAKFFQWNENEQDFEWMRQDFE